jgi:probable rRNA maturation factor
MIKVNVQSDNKFWNKKIKNLKKYLNTRLKKISKAENFLKKKDLTFTILLTNSKNIKKINKKFRKKNKPTDVISFPFFTKNHLKKIKDEKCYIGDLAVSYEIINLRAKKSNFFLEFDKAWIHGLLHLLGYDHIKDIDYYKMIKLEKKIISLINY